jgi:hypothetical protein
MSRGKAIVLAVFTAWPPLYVVLFFCTMFVEVMSDLYGGEHRPEPTLVLLIFPLHFLTMLEMGVLIVVYIVHVFKTDRVPQDKKALWAVVLFLGNIVAMPIYWYLYIWSKPKPVTPDQANRAKEQ